MVRLSGTDGSDRRTGMGSYMVSGDQLSTLATSDMITAARVGEQMKCKVVGRASGVSARSQGVIRILGVRYWKLGGGSKRHVIR